MYRPPGVSDSAPADVDFPPPAGRTRPAGTAYCVAMQDHGAPPDHNHPRRCPDPRRSRRRHVVPAVAGLTLGLGFGTLAGCESGLSGVDKRIEALLDDTTDDLAGDAVTPRNERWRLGDPDAPPGMSFEGYASESPSSVNPGPGELTFDPVDEAEKVSLRLEEEDPTDDVVLLDLEGAWGLAFENSREYKFAEEEYVLAAIRLLIERHRWGPRFFNDVIANVSADGDDYLFDSTATVVNDLGVTQRLPYGGNVSARLLAQASQDLHQRVAGENAQSARIILEADVPLLRGAGISAREPRIQTERDLVYAARRFERARRELIFDIARDFLSLVVQKQQVENGRRQLETLIDLEARERALVRSGRQDPFQAIRAEQNVLFQRDSLSGQLESLRIALDAFKIRLGLSPDVDLDIDTTLPTLPSPDISQDVAVKLALQYRLDLQTQRDRVEDAYRGLEIAKNELLPDLDLSGSIELPTDPDRERAGLRFDPGEVEFEAGVTFGLPLDREIERLSLREQQIRLEQSIRNYEEFRDNVAVLVRAAVRDIQRSRFSLQVQEENVRVSERRQESINAAIDRSTARDRSEAADQLLEARDRRDRAARDLQVAILDYLLTTGQLRVQPDGQLQPLPGMGANPLRPFVPDPPGRDPDPQNPDGSAESTES